MVPLQNSVLIEQTGSKVPYLAVDWGFSREAAGKIGTVRNSLAGNIPGLPGMQTCHSFRDGEIARPAGLPGCRTYPIAHP